ncbi:chorismate-binding protein [uncultured Thiothrix sp.]|uniref:chorismate-binding protein n=1 Tax=uncultured Thiothrix sp. TaxID=223185 RepID=UPI0026126AAF|nr:chorismate-binding protein [uncultured Thiothrix sp.]
MRSLQHCTALLFDASHAQAQSRLYTQPVKVWMIQGNEMDARDYLHRALHEIEAWVKAGKGQVVAALSFEATKAFSVAEGLALTQKSSETPWLQALAFPAPQVLSREQALAWLQIQGQGVTTHLTLAQPAIEQAQFVEHIEAIRELIAAGDTYQVNYTFPLRSELLASTYQDAGLAALYAQLVSNLNIAYGAFLSLPQTSILSFSPELFVEMTANEMICRPMKGTAAIADTEAETERRIELLATDPKNRAENVMIVDLMRNDLARLPEVQQVTVPNLFEVQRYGNVLQMTSTVKASLRKQPSLLSVFNALFPCGSITGAPKRRTLQIIDELEPDARGAYCGAIGFIEPLANEQMHLVLNVPIRTLQTRDKPRIDAANIAHWPLQLSVGAGITYGSEAQAEWEESLLKARFFTRHTQAFELIETMLLEQGSVALLDRHLQRLQRSAEAFGWDKPTKAMVQACIEQAFATVNGQFEPIRLRLSLNAAGQLNTTTSALEPVQQPVKLALSKTAIDSHNPFLQHKTTARTLYNQALTEAKAASLFDYLFCNERGEMTEGSRSNLFVLLNGQWYTPPLSCGLLAGVQRSVLFTELKAQERVLYPDDLSQAQQLLVCNALYGALNAEFIASTLAESAVDNGRG